MTNLASSLIAFPLLGCTAVGTNTSSTDINGGGPIAYATSWIVPIPSRASTFANLTVGLRDIEVIDLSLSPPSITTVVSPPVESCIRYPVSLAVGDVNVDGLDDILVMDPSCGNWIAVGQSNGTFHSMPWSEVLPAVAPHFFLGVVPIEDRRPLVMVATEFRVSTVYRKENGEWKAWNHQFDDAKVPWLSFTDIFAVRDKSLSGFELLFQRGPRLNALTLRIVDEELQLQTSTDIIEQLHGGALRAHDGYDHLIGVTREACDIIALGIGLYPKKAGNIPRKVLALRRTGAQFVAEELPFDCDAFTFGVAFASSDVFVGTLARCGDRTTAQIGRIRECGRSVEVIARQDIEFAWQRPRAPPSYTAPTFAMTDGIGLFVEALDAKTVRLSSYDGFTLRAIVAEEAASWSVREERLQVHVQREDVTW